MILPQTNYAQQVRTLKLVRTSNQSITTATDTAISWTSAELNTGPASWWAVGTPTQIVMPYAGAYLVNMTCSWAGNTTGLRAMHLNSSTTIADANVVAASAIEGITSTEMTPHGNHQSLAQVISVASAGDVYLLVVFQNSGGSLSLTNNDIGTVPAASITLSYLGS